MTTKRSLIAWAVACLFAGGLTTTAAPPEGGDKKVGDALPVVLKTVPAAGDEAVDPGLKEVSVTFSKEMNDKGYSWATDTGRGAVLPSGDNKAAFSKDKKTCTLAVKLEPDTTYAVWINGGKFNSFQDAAGNPSLPYLLVFRTGKAK